MKTKARRQPTEEQKAAAAERRAQIRKLCEIVKAMPEEKRVLLASSFGIRTCEGHELSVYNQCLLIQQNDKVSVVGGFAQWKKLGRSVKKGARALAIWVPCKSRVDAGPGAIVPHGTDPADLEDRFFVLGNVFDIAQTESEAEKAAREVAEAADLPGRALPAPAPFIDIQAEPVAADVPALPAPRAADDFELLAF